MPVAVVLRVSTANGHILTQQRVPHSAITRIITYYWNESEQKWEIGIYYAHVLEHYKPIAFVKRAEMSSLMIAKVVASDNGFLHND